MPPVKFNQRKIKLLKPQTPNKDEDNHDVVKVATKVSDSNSLGEGEMIDVPDEINDWDVIHVCEFLRKNGLLKIFPKCHFHSLGLNHQIEYFSFREFFCNRRNFTYYGKK